MAEEPPPSDNNALPPTRLGVGDAFEVHRQMVIALFIATLFLSIILAVGLKASHVTMLMAVTLAGALGGFVSALRRLYVFQRVFPVNFFKNWRKVNLYLIIYSMIPSLVGGIAAVTLYLIFAAELIKGGMFPKFHLSPTNTKPDDFQNFVANWQPIKPTDCAKALVWSFLAGFSERFVPNLLDRFANSQQHMSNNVAPDRPKPERPVQGDIQPSHKNVSEMDSQT